MCPKLIELLFWNGPTVHVWCFVLARAFTKTSVSRVQKTDNSIYDFRLPPRCRRDLRSSGILRSVEWWDRWVGPKRRYGITTLRCVITQKSADLNDQYFTPPGLTPAGSIICTTDISRYRHGND